MNNTLITTTKRDKMTSTLTDPLCYAIVGSIPYAISYGMHYEVCTDIPYGHMTMSHDVFLTNWCAFLKRHTTLAWLCSYVEPFLAFVTGPTSTHQMVM